MKSLKNWLAKPSSSKILLGLVLVVLFMGFVDAMYLTVNHYTGASNKCFVAQGCDIVTTSEYATVGPIPISLIGTFYYFTAVLLVVLFWAVDSNKFLTLSVILTGVAFGVSLCLVYLQLFVIHALCIYCVTSALATTISFLVLTLLRKYRLRPLA